MLSPRTTPVQSSYNPPAIPPCNPLTILLPLHGPLHRSGPLHPLLHMATARYCLEAARVPSLDAPTPPPNGSIHPPPHRAAWLSFQGRLPLPPHLLPNPRTPPPRPATSLLPRLDVAINRTAPCAGAPARAALRRRQPREPADVADTGWRGPGRSRVYLEYRDGFRRVANAAAASGAAGKRGSGPRVLAAAV